MTLKVPKPRSLRQRNADYAMKRQRMATLAPGLKSPEPARELADYSKLSPLTLNAGAVTPNLQGPLTLEYMGKRKPKLPKL